MGISREICHFTWNYSDIILFLSLWLHIDYLSLIPRATEQGNFSYLYFLQESTPAWTQEAYLPLRSKYSLCSSISGGWAPPSCPAGGTPSSPKRGYPILTWLGYPPPVGWMGGYLLPVSFPFLRNAGGKYHFTIKLIEMSHRSVRSN